MAVRWQSDGNQMAIGWRSDGGFTRLHEVEAACPPLMRRGRLLEASDLMGMLVTRARRLLPLSLEF